LKEDEGATAGISQAAGIACQRGWVFPAELGLE
jgi:hypothetical protein